MKFSIIVHKPILDIVVPCYNEEKNIPLILEKFNNVIKNEEIEVILVNNGSTDNSAKIFEDLLPKFSFARTVLVPVNQGYGYGILQGLKVPAILLRLLKLRT